MKKIFIWFYLEADTEREWESCKDHGPGDGGEDPSTHSNPIIRVISWKCQESGNSWSSLSNLRDHCKQQPIMLSRSTKIIYLSIILKYFRLSVICKYSKFTSIDKGGKWYLAFKADFFLHIISKGLSIKMKYKTQIFGNHNFIFFVSRSTPV